MNTKITSVFPIMATVARNMLIVCEAVVKPAGGWLVVFDGEEIFP